MTSRAGFNDRQKRRAVLGLVLIGLLTAALIATKPWLKEMIGGPMFRLVGTALAIFTLIWSWYISIRWQRGLDEVEKTGQMFAARWGTSAGQAAFALLLMLPPFKNLMIAFVRDWSGDPGAAGTLSSSQ